MVIQINICDGINDLDGVIVEFDCFNVEVVVKNFWIWMKWNLFNQKVWYFGEVGVLLCGFNNLLFEYFVLVVYVWCWVDIEIYLMMFM